jgi:hypothetical protein
MSDPLGFHVSLRLEGSRNLTPTVEARREFGRCVLTIARPFELLACRWVDTHGHLEVMGSREEAGELTRRVEIGLQQRLQPGGYFQPAHFEPMQSIGHVRSTFLYILGQLERHGADVDRFHDASNVPDAIGARRVGAWTAHKVKRHLPRTTREEISRRLASPTRVIDPAVRWRMPPPPRSRGLQVGCRRHRGRDCRIPGRRSSRAGDRDGAECRFECTGCREARPGVGPSHRQLACARAENHADRLNRPAPRYGARR